MGFACWDTMHVAQRTRSFLRMEVEEWFCSYILMLLYAPTYVIWLLSGDAFLKKKEATSLQPLKQLSFFHGTSLFFSGLLQKKQNFVF